jgi:hypothetical protein
MHVNDELKHLIFLNGGSTIDGNIVNIITDEFRDVMNRSTQHNVTTSNVISYIFSNLCSTLHYAHCQEDRDHQ